jgi:hypothetical protein
LLCKEVLMLVYLIGLGYLIAVLVGHNWDRITELVPIPTERGLRPKE